MANECIELFRPGQDISAKASAAVTGCRFVAWTGYFDTANPSTLPTAAHATAAGAVAGVAAYDAANGARFAIKRGKGVILPVTAAAGITAGAEVEVGANGQATTKSAGIAVGRAVSTGTTGNLLYVELY